MQHLTIQALTNRTLKSHLDAAREAFRRHRLANRQGRLYDLYVEHNLFDEARKSRSVMLAHLRAARSHWRTVLGISP